MRFKVLDGKGSQHFLLEIKEKILYKVASTQDQIYLESFLL